MAEDKDIKISRRDFLKIISASAGVGAVIGTGLGKWLTASSDARTAISNIESAGLSENIKLKFKEIIQFRDSLALEGYPPEMIAGLRGKDNWPTGNSTFDTNELPLKNLSYGIYISDVVTNLFGENATHLVKGCKTDPFAPGVMAFDSSTRFCALPEDLHRISSIDEFVNYILHEAGGHGSDPSILSALYPKETFVRVEHGKWQALTQMFAVPGEFLNNPGDSMYPMLKREVGKIVGRAYVDSGNTAGVLDNRGQNRIESVISSLARDQGKDKKDLKFNKKACRDIGAVIVPAAIGHELTMKGDLKTVYGEAMEGVGCEIYAEMLKYSILYPEKVNNPQIFRGIGEVLEAINGEKVDLRALGKTVASPSKEIIDRSIAESQTEQVQQDIGQAAVELPPTEPAPTLSPQERGAIATQQKEFDAEMSDYDSLVNLGKIPSSLIIPANKASSLRKFVDLYVKINTENPGLIERNIAGDDSFDLDMHIWDIEDLGYAMDASFMIGLLQAGEVTDQINSEILKKTAILNRFVGRHIWP